MRIQNSRPIKSLAKICNIILNTNSSQTELHQALDDFSRRCSKVTRITPSASFDAWAEDSFLEQGLAINPQAAAHCVKDYQRSVIFIRGIHSAISTLLNSHNSKPISLLYAGCGPFATLLLPILGKYSHEHENIDHLKVFLLDIHPSSLESANLLLEHFDLNNKHITLIHDNACTYQHPKRLNIIVAETMQKSLEQEPQFMVTANLATQLAPNGIFIPENIVVSLCLAKWHEELALYRKLVKFDAIEHIKTGKRHPLGKLLSLKPNTAAIQYKNAKFNKHTKKYELAPTIIQLPKIKALKTFDVLFLTHIKVYKEHQLLDYESDITLPSICQSISEKNAGSYYQVSYQLGTYPRFNISHIKEK